jgi:hypothetical protein
VSQEISLAGVELAPFASAHDLVGVGDCGGPIKTLAERIAYEGVWRHVVAAHACVDILNELVSMGDGDAPLQDARHGALLQLDYNE